MFAISLDDKAISRFWKYVHVGGEDECWEWTGAKDTPGYGVLKIGGRGFKANRLSWAIHFSDPGDMCVLHKCDNPACVNPKHLFLGTLSDNSIDMMRKGRHPQPDNRGENSGHAKLTWEDVRKIRDGFANRVSTRELANRYHVKLEAIRYIILNEHWIDPNYDAPRSLRDISWLSRHWKLRRW